MLDISKMLDEEKAIKTIDRVYKPSLFNPVFHTSIAISALGGLWFAILDEIYSKIGILSILTALTMFVAGSTWTAYYYRRLNYKRELNDYQKKPDKYEW